MTDVQAPNEELMARLCELISALVLVTGRLRWTAALVDGSTCASECDNRQRPAAKCRHRGFYLFHCSRMQTSQTFSNDVKKRKNQHSPQNQNLKGFTLEDRPEMWASAGKAAAAAAENWLMEAVKFYFALKIVAWTFPSSPTGLSGVLTLMLWSCDF